MFHRSIGPAVPTDTCVPAVATFLVVHAFWLSRSADVTIAACEQKSQTGSEMPQRGSRRLWSW